MLCLGATLVHFKANRFYITEICRCYTLRKKKGKPLFRYATNQSIYEYSPQNSEYWIRCFHSTDYKEEPFLEIKSYINNLSRFGKETLLQNNALGCELELQGRKEDPSSSLAASCWYFSLLDLEMNFCGSESI